jgi:hypothetical protein
VKVKKIPTWFWEQAAFTTCLAVAVYGQSRTVSGSVLGCSVVAAMSAFAAQKVRSGADRQAEQDRLHNVEHARIACADRIERWAAIAQILAVSAMLHRGLWDLPAIMFVILYPFWRSAYRLRVPARLDGGSVSPPSTSDVSLEDATMAIENATRIISDARAYRELSKPTADAHRIPDVETLIETVASEQLDGENLLDTATRVAGESRKYREQQDTILDAIERQREGEMHIEPDDVETDETTVFTRPQPNPVNADGPALWPMIAKELEHEARACAKPVYALVAKYGVPLVASNGRDHLVDAYQEALDAIVYMRAYHEQTKTITSRNLYESTWLMASRVREVLHERDGK